MSVKDNFSSNPKLKTTEQQDGQSLSEEEHQLDLNQHSLHAEKIDMMVLENQKNHSSTEEQNDSLFMKNQNPSIENCQFQLVSDIPKNLKAFVNANHTFVKSNFEPKNRKVILDWFKKNTKVLKFLQLRLAFLPKQLEFNNQSSQKTIQNNNKIEQNSTFNNFKQVLTNADFSQNPNLTQPKIGFQNVQVNHNGFDFLENRFRFDQKNEEFIAKVNQFKYENIEERIHAILGKKEEEKSDDQTLWKSMNKTSVTKNSIREDSPWFTRTPWNMTEKPRTFSFGNLDDRPFSTIKILDESPSIQRKNENQFLKLLNSNSGNSNGQSFEGFRNVVTKRSFAQKNIEFNQKSSFDQQSIHIIDKPSFDQSNTGFIEQPSFVQPINDHIDKPSNNCYSFEELEIENQIDSDYIRETFKKFDNLDRNLNSENPTKHNFEKINNLNWGNCHNKSNMSLNNNKQNSFTEFLPNANGEMVIEFFKKEIRENDNGNLLKTIENLKRKI